jgi:hypothetical protein
VELLRYSSVMPMLPVKGEVGFTNSQNNHSALVVSDICSEALTVMFRSRQIQLVKMSH